MRMMGCEKLSFHVGAITLVPPKTSSPVPAYATINIANVLQNFAEITNVLSHFFFAAAASLSFSLSFLKGV
jgi:hypothetical protein